MRIVANTAVEAVKRRERENHRHVDVDLADDLIGDTLTGEMQAVISAHPEAALESAELRQTIWEALERLSPDQRAVVVLRYYADYSEREVAAALNIPSGTVSWRLHNARRQLRAALNHLYRPHDAAPSRPTKQPKQRQSKQEGSA